ncbi:Uncharacterised protein [Burkholderia pseudomallei]|uniref:DUF4062 domain-containing protein n=1 Tax=Burkholderia pseudomallei TaxID=28450 RepID=UPI000F046098|nr:DUF4062 domain-containing protein [Burkholderia pseudomallei]CAJ7430962.1 Uncharacterised protein [Burkholderia pseudomallei]VBG90880.1 Uncharacterised protein [Burkholderia pseudomallei]VBR90898.1 Uncharacterised protein [Burkholderia pseudomallei]
MDKKYQVFVSSTFTDMQAERQAAVTAILEAGHIPAGMELFAASDKKQIEVIRRWIDRSDMFMLILGGRYGSVDPDSGKSYIQLEYEYAVATGKPFFALYLTESAIEKKAKGPLGLDAVERNDTIKLNEFRATVKARLCSEVDDVKDIRIQVPKAIREISDTNTLDGWVRASSVPAVDRANDGQAVLAPKIEIITEPSAPYQVDEILSEHVRSTVKIGIRNAGGNTLSNCKVYIEDISPPTNSPGGPTLLLDGSGFQLRYDDPEKLVDVAAHWDNHDKFRFSTPIGGGFFDTTQLMDERTRRTFSIRVAATQCNRSARFEIWADESKKLHLAFLNYID